MDVQCGKKIGKFSIFHYDAMNFLRFFQWNYHFCLFLSQQPNYKRNAGCIWSAKLSMWLFFSDTNVQILHYWWMWMVVLKVVLTGGDAYTIYRTLCPIISNTRFSLCFVCVTNVCFSFEILKKSLNKNIFTSQRSLSKIETGTKV